MDVLYLCYGDTLIISDHKIVSFTDFVMQMIELGFSHEEILEYLNLISVEVSPIQFDILKSGAKTLLE